MTQTTFTIAILTVIALLGLALYYIKFKSDEQAKKTKGPGPGRKNPVISSTEPDEDKYWQDRYNEIIEDFPTHVRNN